ncbi:MAG: hypothetical protein mread185_000263 [Mycoplasmataceae bacterium]|nr:MAG: hypothetical protein mread185_000263 [Mycoplasmataceae bacterium]
MRSTGGRPTKYHSHEARLEARRKQRAIRLGKNPDELRDYRSITEIQGQNSNWNFEGQCDHCGGKVWGGNPNTEGSQCQSCHWGSYRRIDKTTIRRAMTSAERVRAYRERLRNR